MSTNSVVGEQLALGTIGGPTAVLELGGLRLVTDPTFDPPGDYEPRPGVHLTKTEGPARAPDELGPVDVVSLSHDHHKDNLDDAGRAFLARALSVLTTVSGAERLGHAATALPNWETIEVQRPNGGTLSVTGVPAQHGPDGAEQLTGDVTGFVSLRRRSADRLRERRQRLVGRARRIVDRLGRVDVAVLFVGGAQLPYVGDGYLTLPSALAAEAAKLLGARLVVPGHLQGWKPL